MGISEDRVCQAAVAVGRDRCALAPPFCRMRGARALRCTGFRCSGGQSCGVC